MENITSKLLLITNKIGKLCFLNLLYMIFCIPIITIGASEAALYTCIFLIIDNKEGYLTRSFLSSFKEHLKQSALLWIVLCLLWAFLGLDLFWTKYLPGRASLLGAAVLIVLILYLFCLSCYFFAFLARFRVRTRNLLRSCFILTAKYPLLTFILAMMNAAVFLPLCLRPSFFFSILPVIVFLGFSGAAYINGRILNHIFAKEGLIDARQKETAAQ